MTVSATQVDTVKTRRRIEDALRKSATPEKLIAIAKVLSIEVAVLTLPVECCSRTGRPDFGPGQVRSFCELWEGYTYQETFRSRGKNENGRLFVVVREPYCIKDQWWMIVKHHNVEDKISLADHSICPYGNGRWNTRNFIAFTDQSRHLRCPAHRCCYRHDHPNCYSSCS